MNIATLNPAAIRTFKPGTFFYSDFAGHGYAELALVCALEQAPAEPRVILKVAAAMMFQENDLLAFNEEQDRVAVPLQLASVETNPAMVRLNSSSGAADGVNAIDAIDFVVADARGYWVRYASELWVNLATGLIAERAPSGPWVELGNLQLLDGEGHTFAELSALPNC